MDAWVGKGVPTLVTVDAVLALDAGLAGRASEALSTLTHACAIHSVQADTISEADVLGIPWAGLALGPEEARAALSRLQRKDKAGLGQGRASNFRFCLVTMSPPCWWDWVCVPELPATREEGL